MNGLPIQRSRARSLAACGEFELLCLIYLMNADLPSLGSLEVRRSEAGRPRESASRGARPARRGTHWAATANPPASVFRKRRQAPPPRPRSPAWPRPSACPRKHPPRPASMPAAAAQHATVPQAYQRGPTRAQLLAVAKHAAAHKAGSGLPNWYTVRPGDTLSSIAVRYAAYHSSSAGRCLYWPTRPRVAAAERHQAGQKLRHGQGARALPARPSSWRRRWRNLPRSTRRGTRARPRPIGGPD